MSFIWIKICGITREQDAHAVAKLGVDAIGLVFYPASPRAVTVTQATAVLRDIPRDLQVFGLFVNPSVQEVEAALGVPGISHLQFHGNEPAAFCESFGVPYMKAFRVRSAQATLAEVENYQTAQYILLDSYEKDVHGGTGKTFDWSYAATIASECDAKIVLAGGLQPGNVVSAVETVHPFGVDVSSGVESAPGIKAIAKIESFVKGVRSVGS